MGTTVGLARCPAPHWVEEHEKRPRRATKKPLRGGGKMGRRAHIWGEEESRKKKARESSKYVRGREQVQYRIVSVWCGAVQCSAVPVGRPQSSEW